MDRTELKRRQFEQFGLVSTVEVPIEELPDDFGQNYSRDFSFSKFTTEANSLPTPTSQLDILDLTAVLEYSMENIEQLNPDNHLHVKQMTNLHRSMVILYTTPNMYTSARIPLDIEVNDPTVSDEGELVEVLVFNDELFLVICRIQLFVLPEHARRWTADKDFPVVLENMLLDCRLSDKPIMSFSVDELFGAFNLLCSHWHELYYHEVWNSYASLLVTRAAELYYKPYNSRDALIPEKEIENHNRTRSLRRKAIQSIGWCMQEIWQKLKIHQWMISQRERPPQFNFSVRDYNRLYRLALNSDKADDTLDAFREECLDYLIMPGERTAFRDQFPKIQLRADRVLTSRVNVAAEALSMQQEALMKSVRGNIEDDTLFGSCVADLALLHLVSYYVRTTSALSLDSFVVRSPWLFRNESSLGEQLMSRTSPMIVQSFNWFGILYEQQFYEHNDIIKCVLHWMQIISGKPFYGKVNGVTIDALLPKTYDFFINP